MFIMRLDDASEYMDVSKWDKIEKILDKYDVKPIVGVIPKNEDESLVGKYNKDENFWKKVKCWQNKKWTIAMHGYNHVYITECGGINPVNKRSEFAGVEYTEQCKKIVQGIKILQEQGIDAEIFFAPSHTFDENTIKALKEKSNIRVISDTIANDIYYKDDMFYIPQQSGKVRNLPLKVVTFCYHPNIMVEEDYRELEMFLMKNKNKFTSYSDLKLQKRQKGILDNILNYIYFFKR